MQLSSTKLVRAAQGLRAYATLVRDPNRLGSVAGKPVASLANDGRAELQRGRAGQAADATRPPAGEQLVWKMHQQSTIACSISSNGSEA